MIDIHSHLLPGIDDGPRSWDQAIDLCRAMSDDGILRAVATPHLIDGVYNNTVIPCDLRCPLRRYKAAGIIAVGQYDHDAFINFAAFKQVDRQPHGITEHGSWPQHADLCFIEQFPDDIQIIGKRHLHKCGRTKQDQSDPVTVPAGEERIQHLFDSG